MDSSDMSDQASAVASVVVRDGKTADAHSTRPLRFGRP